MDTQTINGIIGIACLAFAAIGTFLLVPDRELSGRERLGIHTIFWAFIIYAIWIIYQLVWQDPKWNLLDKCFYISVPILLGLLLSLLSEFTAKRPPFDIEDARINNIANQTWNRIPTNVKRGLQNTIMRIQGIPEWSDLDKDIFKNGRLNAARWFPILPFPAKGIIHLSIGDCKDMPDDSITGALSREFGHAYQSTLTPFDTDAIDKAGDTLPAKWGFKKEIDALNAKFS
ncbi:MAG: hypothetical protein EHM12_01455 [Dehalococcoidia bacterium]|nr:MAG: hypothetical protein EHM12_01455 [Dehalococcoidia bacterium]